MKKVELLAPAGNFKRLKLALYYGADAVYLAGKKFGLRASADNFTPAELKKAVNLCHKAGKKIYVTLNIVAHNSDFVGLVPYIKFLDRIGVDAVIVSDLGIASLVKANSNLALHVSTQANVTNKVTAKVWASLGASRIVLARELNIEEIREIRRALPKNVELEAFVHGAMCIAHSGRCLLSNVFVGRDGNKGACVQACRFAYNLVRTNNEGEQYPIQEDAHGTYILNSKDMCLIEHLKEIADAGVYSFKIEGRMKSDYYVANVTNAYRRAIDALTIGKEPEFSLQAEAEKSSHRENTTGFYFGDEHKTNLKSSGTTQTYDVVAEVIKKSANGKVTVSQRNKFELGDEVEVLSPSSSFLKTFKIESITNEKGDSVKSANHAEEVLTINTPVALSAGDMLRKKK